MKVCAQSVAQRPPNLAAVHDGSESGHYRRPFLVEAGQPMGKTWRADRQRHHFPSVAEALPNRGVSTPRRAP